MGYIDWLPKKAVICAPMFNTSVNDETNAARTYHSASASFFSYALHRISYANTFDGSEWLEYSDPTPEYGIGGGTGASGYATGDEVQISDVGMKFKYAGIDELIVSDSSDLLNNHPMLLDDFGNRVNSTIWTPLGAVEDMKLFDGSSSTFYEHSIGFPQLGARLRFTTGSPINLMGYMLHLVADAEYADVIIYENDGTVLDTFTVDMNFKTSLTLYFDESKFSTSGGNETVQITLRSTYKVTKIFECFVSNKIYELGSQLYGHTSYRTSEFKTVISDGVEKSMVTKSYDVFDGHVLVDEADLQKAEYALAKATQGDYVFHTGTGKEIYDQRVYLGKIKYRSPIEDASGKYKINISGQSLSYGVENPLIAPDSTDGYAQ